MESTQHLGVLNGPVLLFGGPYSNFAATRAIRQVADARGIPPERCICTGDIVAYCAEPSETLELIRHWGIPVVMGNCEESLAHAAEDCGCGFEEGSACSVLSERWYAYASSCVSAEQRAWMATLPRSLTFVLAGKRVRVVHGSPGRINEFIFSSTSRSIKQGFLEQTESDLIVGGHCGLPFGQRLENGYWLNTGAIGLPANDGTSRGWFLLLEPHSDSISASWHPLIYPCHLSVAAMRERGLDNGYADALETGLWPSTDVLPDEEKRATGRAVALSSLSID
ncbi:hypothetical protein ADIMK_3015 [Marinobacterium lacunae]|uniref:Calcineurin-like phosphoesterase domain-containing protein n=1 Tax=Marinobacterium lacunae TaxID=1232683 RepID=A0A081FWB1_9GAMM|nr:metallophosphoesterase family protein [Marinobacterium lacunae]KEA62816.1 hypothetical protein ADIMK_3015 [Marinobacterium lacunae]